MSKNIREILKNKIMISSIVLTTAAVTGLAIGLSTTKKQNTNNEVQHKVAQVEEFNKEKSENNEVLEEKKEETPIVENKLEAKAVEVNDFNNNSKNEKQDVKKVEAKKNIYKEAKKNISKPVVTKKVTKKITSIKVVPVKAISTKENQELLNQRDDLNKQIEKIKEEKNNKKVEDKTLTVNEKDTNLISENITTQISKEEDLSKDVIEKTIDCLTNEIAKEDQKEKEALAKIKEAEEKILAQRENIKAIILENLNAIKDVTPKSVSELAKVSNKAINAMENAKAYNKMVLADKNATEEIKKEASDFLDKADKELKRITSLAETMKSKEKDVTWGEYFDNLYDYANEKAKVAYNYIAEEAVKSYNDVLETATNVYNVSKNAYDTAKYTYESFDNIKTSAKDLSELSGVVGTFNKENEEFLEGIKPFVKDYDESTYYKTIAEEKIKGAVKLVKTVLTSNEEIDLTSNKKKTSIITPITNVVDIATNFANGKVNKLKGTVALSNTYVTTKETVKNLANTFWGLFGAN